MWLSMHFFSIPSNRPKPLFVSPMTNDKIGWHNHNNIIEGRRTGRVSDYCLPFICHNIQLNICLPAGRIPLSSRFRFLLARAFFPTNKQAS